MTERQLRQVRERLDDPPPQPPRKTWPCPRCGNPKSVSHGTTLSCDECLERDFADLDIGDSPSPAPS